MKIRKARRRLLAQVSQVRKKRNMKKMMIKPQHHPPRNKNDPTHWKGNMDDSQD
jgi:hypothetical protein